MKLIKIGENTNNIENLKEFGEDQEFFHLDFRVTSKCNYDCYYCTDMHNNKNKFITFNLDNLEDVIKNISRYTKKPIHIFLYGGEPSIHPDILTILKRLASALKKYNLGLGKKPVLEIQTNLSLNIEKYVEMAELLKEYQGIFKISGSFHNTQAEYSSFIKKCKTILDLGFLGMITFMYNSKNKNINKLYIIARGILGKDHAEISPLISSSVSEKPTAREVSPFYEIDYIFKNEDIGKLAENSYVFQNGIPVKYLDGAIEYTSRAEMWHNRSNSFTGFHCNVSRERCIVDYSGKVFNCFGDMFDPITKPVFNINSTDLDSSVYFKNLKTIRCVHKKCFFELEHKKTAKE